MDLWHFGGVSWRFYLELVRAASASGPLRGVAYYAPAIALGGLYCAVRLAFLTPAKGNLPRCARCGYPAVGLPAPRCPECGASLGVAGAIRTKSFHRRWRLALLLLWGAVILIGGFAGVRGGATGEHEGAAGVGFGPPRDWKNPRSAFAVDSAVRGWHVLFVRSRHCELQLLCGSPQRVGASVVGYAWDRSDVLTISPPGRMPGGDPPTLIKALYARHGGVMRTEEAAALWQWLSSCADAMAAGGDALAVQTPFPAELSGWEPCCNSSASSGPGTVPFAAFVLLLAALWCAGAAAIYYAARRAQRAGSCTWVEIARSFSVGPQERAQ